MSITSLMRPGRAVITATRSPSRIASSIEWVMNTDRKSTRLNSSHDQISYAVFCLKKKKKHKLFLRGQKITIQTSSQDSSSYTVLGLAHTIRDVGVLQVTSDSLSTATVMSRTLLLH